MPSEFFVGPPGVTAPVTATFKTLFVSNSEQFLAQGKYIAGDASRDPSNTVDPAVLQPGLLMGKIATVINGKGTVGWYAPSVLGLTVGATLAAGVTITVAAAVATEIIRRIGSAGSLTVVGPATAGGTVTSRTVAYSAVGATTITITAMGTDLVAGSLIGPTDGSQLPLTLISDWDPGIRVTDNSGVSVAQVDFQKVAIAGVIDCAQVINFPPDVATRLWLEQQLSSQPGGKFSFAGVGGVY